MLTHSRSFRTCILFAVSTTFILACNLPAAIPPSQPVAGTQTATALSPIVNTPTTDIVSPPPVASATAFPAFTPSASVPTTAMSATPDVVTVRVAGGNLNVRRGPGAEYNPIGGLLDGQSSTASARNDDASWLYISIPSTTKSGWVSTRTKYSTVSGDPMSLPLMTVAPAAPAYIRNCTFHEMLVKPVGVNLPDQTNSPDNKQQFSPGEYIIVDTTTSSQVAGLTLFEGKTIDIKKDGLGNTYSCP